MKLNFKKQVYSSVTSNDYKLFFFKNRHVFLSWHLWKRVNISNQCPGAFSIPFQMSCERSSFVKRGKHWSNKRFFGNTQCFSMYIYIYSQTRWQKKNVTGHYPSFSCSHSLCFIFRTVRSVFRIALFSMWFTKN